MRRAKVRIVTADRFLCENIKKLDIYIEILFWISGVFFIKFSFRVQFEESVEDE